MSYTTIDLSDEWIKGKTPDEIRVGVKEDYIVIRKRNSTSAFSIPQRLHDLIQKPETGAVYCEPPDKVFPIIQPHLQFRFEPDVIAIKTSLFNNTNVNLNNLFDTLICVYNKAIVRRV